MISLKRDYFRVKIRKTDHQQVFNNLRAKAWVNCLSEQSFYEQVDFQDHQSLIGLLKCLNENTNKVNFTRQALPHLLQIVQQEPLNLELIFNLNFFLDFECPEVLSLIQSTEVMYELIETIEVDNYDMKIYILAQFAQHRMLRQEIIDSYVIFDILEIFNEILENSDQIQISTYKSYFILLYMLINNDNGEMDRSLRGIYKALLCIFMKIDDINFDQALGFIIESAMKYDFCAEQLKGYFYILLNRMFVQNIRSEIVKSFWMFCNNWITTDVAGFYFFCRDNTKILNLVTYSLENQNNPEIIQEILWALESISQDEVLLREFIFKKYHHKIYNVIQNLQTPKMYENYFKVIYGFLIKNDKNFVDTQLVEMLEKCLRITVEESMKQCVNYIVKNLQLDDLAYLIDLL